MVKLKVYSYTKALGDCVRAARKKKGLTQAELAELIHSDKRTILNIENYRGNPKLDTLYDLVTTLEINPKEIFFPDNNKSAEALNRFGILTASCSDEEIALVLRVCEVIVSNVHSKEQIPI